MTPAGDTLPYGLGALDALDALRAVAARGGVITDDLLQQIHANLLAGRAWDALEPFDLPGRRR